MFRKKKIATKVEKIFLKYDRNGDEKLQPEEILAYLRKEDPGISNEAFELLFDEIDTDKNGEISKEELYDYYILQEPDCDENDCISKRYKLDDIGEDLDDHTSKPKNEEKLDKRLSVKLPPSRYSQMISNSPITSPVIEQNEEKSSDSETEDSKEKK